MKAWVVERLGGPEGFRLREVPDPQPGPDEVVLRLEGLGLNLADGLLLQGAYLTRLPPPFVPGMEAVGGWWQGLRGFWGSGLPPFLGTEALQSR